MKVCYVTHLPNLTGASRSLLDILSKWDKNKVEAVVLLGKHGPLEEELKKLNIRYKIIPYSTEIMENGKTFVNFAKKIKSYRAVSKIKKFFEDEKFDLIHSNSFLVGAGMEAAFQADMPYICHLRDFVWEDHRIKLLNDKRQYFLLNHADTAIAISDAVRDKFSALAKDAHFETVYDGVDVSKYLQKHHNILCGEHFVMMLPGRIAPGKGQLEAVKAAEELVSRGVTDFTLQIIGGIGDADYADEIKSYVKKQSINQVEFIEFTNDLYGLRAKCDLGLVCSSAEALGRVTIENMLTGCLTIGADAGATSELIQDGVTGLLYEQGNHKDLADKIQYALGNREDMKRIAENGQKYAAEKFDSCEYDDKLYCIYKSILE